MKRILSGILCIALLFSGCSSKEKILEPTAFDPESVTNDAGIITFLDIGEVSPLLIQNGSYTILVDTGDDKSYSDLKSALSSRSISVIDCLIVTSPLSNYTGAASELLDDFNVRQVIMPKWPPEVKSMTASFVDFANKLQTKSISYMQTSYGFATDLGSVKLTALGPQGETYADDENFSMICKFQFGMVSMLYMSCAYGAAEQELVSGRITTRSDILVMTNMHDKESNLDEFVSTVDPSIVIVPGRGKKPQESMIEKYTDAQAEVHQVRDHGNIVITTDGANIGVSSDYYLTNETEDITYEVPSDAA